MFRETLTVTNPAGLHARPAGQLVQLCKGMADDVRIVHPKGVANPKNILNVLTAGLKAGTEITIEVEGSNEQESGEKIVAFIKSLKD